MGAPELTASLAPWAAAEALGTGLAELARFQDEPPQMASGIVGKTGFLRRARNFHVRNRSARADARSLDGNIAEPAAKPDQDSGHVAIARQNAHSCSLGFVLR